MSLCAEMLWVAGF